MLANKKNVISMFGVKILQASCMSFISAIEPLKDKDNVLDYGSLGNFSLSGFEMVLTRYVSTYIITYYLPSGN